MLRSPRVSGPRALRILLSAGLFSGALPQAARAQFPWTGARATGMGGAQVAAVDDATAAWSNPAALARLGGWTVQLFGGGLGSNRNNLLGTVDRLSGLPFDEIARGNRLDLLPGLLDDLNRLTRSDTGVLFSGVGGLVVSGHGFALSGGVVPYAGIAPVVDLTHVVPGGGVGNGLAFNESGLSFRGLEAREVRLAYGRVFASVLEVGGAARLVFGRTFFTRCGVFDCGGENLEELIRDAFHKNARDSTDFTFDLGARLNLGIVKLGVVGASLNEPTFEVAPVPGAPASVALPRQVRGGVSVDALPFLSVAADADLLESDTLVPGAHSRQVSLGAEVRLPLFALRAGAMRDLAATDPHWTYSVGLGVSAALVAVDVGILMSPRGGLDPTSLNREDLAGAANVRVQF